MQATTGLIFVNVVMFILMQAPPGSLPVPSGREMVERGECITWRPVPGASPMKREGVWCGEAWRLLTAMFLHANLLHIFLNMMGLYYLGYPLEAQMGTGRFLIIYFAAGLYGYVVSLVFLDLATPTLGASGAIFGLFGALIGVEMQRGAHPLEFLQHDYGKQLAGYAVFNLVLGFIFPRINNAAHIGGFACGMLLVNVGLVRRIRGVGVRGWALRGVALLLALLIGTYGFFPAWKGYWHLNRAFAEDARGDKYKALFSLHRAITLDKRLLYYKETRELARRVMPPRDKLPNVQGNGRE